MKVILVVVLLSYYAEARTPTENCIGATVIHNIKYEHEILKKLRIPYQLAMDYNTNTLFFSYSKDNKDIIYESAYINLKTNEFGTIHGIATGFANAVDEHGNVVYLGASDGIYQFNYETKVATRLNGTDDTIWQLFFKKDLYYTKFPEEEIYIFKNNQSHRVPELIDTNGRFVAVDNSDNIYFSNTTGLFIHKKITDNTSFVGNYYDVNGFTYDINGALFFSTPQAIYYINDSIQEVEKIASFDSLYGIAIEADGTIIYALEDSLVRLKPTNTYCYSNETKNQ
ncbi:ommochrome-binding protein-like isoform X1 [Maniola jurtina]|uniref:ommochrome-binding protein-like isoform X1 n=1 Tax=Maniola jurtina TaxID=191418 RepID=UPI001E689888|nr:ommochrome-binding protein-like isoform X1 [Maniola jurtina]